MAVVRCSGECPMSLRLPALRTIMPQSVRRIASVAVRSTSGLEFGESVWRAEAGKGEPLIPAQVPADVADRRERPRPGQPFRHQLVHGALDVCTDVLVAHPPRDLRICAHPFWRVDVDAAKQFSLGIIEQRVVEGEVLRSPAGGAASPRDPARSSRSAAASPMPSRRWTIAAAATPSQRACRSPRLTLGSAVSGDERRLKHAADVRNPPVTKPRPLLPTQVAPHDATPSESGVVGFDVISMPTGAASGWAGLRARQCNAVALGH